jgi:hypothetical protein
MYNSNRFEIIRPFSHSSKGRLTARDLGRFPGNSLFDNVGRAVCDAGCLPRKELFEAWEMARRIRRVLRGGRIVDLAAGHGLLAHVLMILDNSSPLALVVDTTLPKSSTALHDVIVQAWPRLKDRFRFEERPLESVVLTESDLVVSGHACGALADLVIDRASGARARVAVLPCCHDLTMNNAGPLSGWMVRSRWIRCGPSGWNSVVIRSERSLSRRRLRPRIAFSSENLW